MRTNKTQRIAINLTKLADSVDALDFSTGLYSIAKDSNIAMIESDNFGLIDFGIVFVPQNEWHEAYEAYVRQEKYGCALPEARMQCLIRRYYALAHGCVEY